MPTESTKKTRILTAETLFYLPTKSVRDPTTFEFVHGDDGFAGSLQHDLDTCVFEGEFERREFELIAERTGAKYLGIYVSEEDGSTQRETALGKAWELLRENDGRSVPSDAVQVNGVLARMFFSSVAYAYEDSILAGDNFGDEQKVLPRYEVGTVEWAIWRWLSLLKWLPDPVDQEASYKRVLNLRGKLAKGISQEQQLDNTVDLVVERFRRDLETLGKEEQGQVLDRIADLQSKQGRVATDAQIAKVKASVAGQLKEAFKRSGKTKLGLSSEIGISRSTLDRLFTPESNPEFRTLYDVVCASNSSLRIAFGKNTGNIEEPTDLDELITLAADESNFDYHEIGIRVGRKPNNASQAVSDLRENPQLESLVIFSYAIREPIQIRITS